MQHIGGTQSNYKGSELCRMIPKGSKLLDLLFSDGMAVFAYRIKLYETCLH